MNWLERLNNIELEIQTGDGKKYTPLWRNAQINIDFNAEGFDFIERDGSYIARKRVSGRKFPLLLFFQGENHLDTANAFYESAKDPRPWRIKHPLYDVLLVQPIDLKFDNSAHNVTRITGTVWETNEEKLPQSRPSKPKAIERLKSQTDGLSVDVSANNLADVDTAIIQESKTSINSIGNNIEKYIDDTDLIQEFRNNINAALSSSDNIVSDTFAALEATQQAIDTIVRPDLISISDKIEAFKTILTDIKDTLLGVNRTDDTVALYELQASTILTSASLASVLASYNNRNEVVDVIGKIGDMYSGVSLTFDEIEQNQDANIAQALDSIINETLANLYVVAFNSRQIRRYVTQADTNIIVLAHQFYGPGDNNLNEFISQNNISLSEHLKVKKNREIIYFV
jgi:hypothetical protein